MFSSAVIGVAVYCEYTLQSYPIELLNDNFFFFRRITKLPDSENISAGDRQDGTGDIAINFLWDKQSVISGARGELTPG